jgi:hypothetical protein
MPEKNIAMKHYQQFSSHHLEHAKKKNPSYISSPMPLYKNPQSRPFLHHSAHTPTHKTTKNNS